MGTLTPQFGTILPSQKQELLNSNYLKFNTGGANDFIQQYLPEVYEQEVERYGNRTLSGFLRMVGAEMPMTSDQVIWSEQNRLHIAYDDIAVVDGAGTSTDLTLGAAAGQEMVMSINDTIVVLDPATGLEAKCIVIGVTPGGPGAGSVNVECFDPVGGLVATQGFSAAGCKMFVYGSAYSKGTTIGNGAGNSAARNCTLH